MNKTMCYELKTLCSDEEHNNQFRDNEDLKTLCSKGLLVLKVPQVLHRLLVRRIIAPDENAHNGRWIFINIDYEYLLRFFVEDFDQLDLFVKSLCSVCYHTVLFCKCPLGYRHPVQFMIVDRFGDPVIDDRTLNAATHGKNSFIQVLSPITWDRFEKNRYSTGSIEQSGKTYTEIVNNPSEVEPFIKIIEDAVCLLFQLKRSRNMCDVTVAMSAFIRSITGRSSAFFLKDLVSKMCELLSSHFKQQSSGHWTETLSDVYENYGRCKNTILAKKFKKVFNHLIAHSVYHKLNIEVDRDLFAKFEKKVIRPNLIDCFTFVDAIAGLLTFLLKQGRQAMISGSIEPLFLSGDSLSHWFTVARKLKSNYEFLGNPEAAGFQLHTYLEELDRTIIEGQCISKYQDSDNLDRKFTLSVVNELESMRKRYLSMCAASTLRKQPLGVVLYGDPGTGKSSVLEMLYNYDSLIRGRDPSPNFKYQVPSDSDHFNNFRSWYHCLVLDDVGQHTPGKIQGIDPSVSMLIRINNNQAFCPPQASLEDKGKTPVLVDLMFATTNVLDLNLPIYFPKSYAPMRRLQIHIEPIVKPEYRVPNSMKIDPNLTMNNGCYHNYWNFKVREPVEVGQMRGEFREIKYPKLADGRQLTCFENNTQLLDWWKAKSDAHALQQKQFMTAMNSYSGCVLHDCGLPHELCECSTAQVGCVRNDDGTTTPIDVYNEADGTTTRINLREANHDHRGHHLFDTDETPDVPGVDFNQFFDEEDDPWRNKKIVQLKRNSRFFSGQILRTFYQYAQKIKDAKGRSYPLQDIKEYSLLELPKVYKYGFTDVEVLGDLEGYLAYKVELRTLQEADGLMDCLRASIRTDKNYPKIMDKGWFDKIFQACVYAYFNFAVFKSAFNHLGSYAFIRRRAMPLLRSLIVRRDNQKYVMMTIGNRIDQKLGGLNKLIQGFLIMLSLVSVGGVLFYMHQRIKTTVYPHAEEEEQEEPLPGCEIIQEGEFKGYHRELPKDENITEEKPLPGCHIVKDGPLKGWHKEGSHPSEDGKETGSQEQFGIYPKALNESQKANPWVSKERTVTSVDFCPGRLTETNAFLRNLSHNILPFLSTGTDHIGNFRTHGNFLVLNNTKLLTNNHSLNESGPLRMVVHLGASNGRIKDCVYMEIQQSQIMRIPNRDIAIITTKALPARFKNIINNFPKKSYDGRYGGFYYKKQPDGNMSKIPMMGIERCKHFEQLGPRTYDLIMFRGKLQQPTDSGDCGLPLIIETGYGPIIGGFHSLFHFRSMEASSVAVFWEDIQQWLIEPMEAEVGIVEVDTEVTESSKSFLDYHENGEMVYHGELKGFRARPKHSVFDTELAQQAYGRKVCEHEITRRLGPPVMDSWRPQQINLKEFLEPVKYMNEVLLEECAQVFFSHIMEHLDPSELELLHTYPLDVAVNGAPGIKFVDGVKRSTSMGYPWKKTKRGYLIPLEDPKFLDGVKFVPEIEERIFQRLEKMKQKLRVHPVFSANLKDEPVSLKKITMCKTRVFFSCPTDFLIIVRMCFMGFCRVVMRNPYVFKVAVGLNPHSSDWDDIFQYLSQFNILNTIAGDHAFYDKKMKLLLMKIAMTLVINIMERAGQCTPLEILIFRVVVHDMVNPSVDYFGMLIQLLGGEVSGHQMTTILNCICNILYLMYCYSVIYGSPMDFFDHVAAIALGDDHVLTVSDARPKFNHTAVQAVMKDMGLDYTMAEKDAESVPYINLHDAPFLKRKFKYMPEVGKVVGPLEVNSIFKMITIGVKSKAVSSEEQLAQAICAASAESFYHGREFFDEFHSLLDSFTKTPELQHEMLRYPTLTWEEHKRRFLDSCSSYVAISDGHNQNPTEEDSDCFIEITVPQSMKRMDLLQPIPTWAIPKVRIYGRSKLEPNKERKEGMVKTPLSHENKRLATQISNGDGHNNHQKPVTDDSSHDVHQQQTIFAQEPLSETLDISTPFDRVADVQVTTAHLKDFMSRPTYIYQYRWTENSAPGLKDSFDPWNLYFNTAAIKNKLQGFHLLRANLHLKFMVNGSPFYYGKIGAMYRPLAKTVNNTVPTSVPTALQQICVSQRPHVWLDNQSTSNAEMIVPFLYPTSFMPTTNLVEFTNMGTVELWQYAALRSANGITSAGIDITVYAYAEDFELGGLTHLSIMQSKTEYSANGTISGPASTVGKVASKLKNVPVIGPFATATESAAKMVGGIASIFGFTNVPNIKDVDGIKPMPFQLASSSISEPVMKLSLQPKQEIAVGSMQDGASQEDELHLNSFLSRESFLCGTLWTTSSATNDNLFVAGVSPEFYAFDTTTLSVAHTPMSYLCPMFNYWRGSIIFRFKVVRSQYHRGRLNISWDVGGSTYIQAPNIGDPSSMNVVLDLDESDEIEVEIPYTKARPFLETQLSGSSGLPTARNWENSNTPALFATDQFNGIISVKVMNRLTAPELSSDVDLLVFVRAGKDFKFAGPSEINPNWTHSSLTNSHEQSDTSYCLGNKGGDDDVFKEVFGENIVSLRELLHRSSLNCTLSSPLTGVTDGVVNLQIPLKRYPRPPGIYNNGWDSGVKPGSSPVTYIPINYTRMHPINWILPCFVGYKGSVNITVNICSTRYLYHIDSMNICRLNLGSELTADYRRPVWNAQSVTAAVSSSALNKNFQNQYTWGHDGISGMGLTNQKTNSGLCVNLPYYVGTKFLTTDPYVQYSNEDTITDSVNDWYTLSYKFRNDNSTTALRHIVHDVYYSTGPDFDVVFFLNIPIVFFRDVASAA